MTTITSVDQLRTMLDDDRTKLWRLIEDVVDENDCLRARVAVQSAAIAELEDELKRTPPKAT